MSAELENRHGKRKQAEEGPQSGDPRPEKANAELRRHQARLVQQERLDALRRMAGRVVHDFNNALMPILGFSELLLDRLKGLDNKDAVHSDLHKINMAAQDAMTVVSRLRGFYRKRHEGEVFTPVSLDDLVGQTLSLAEAEWKDEAQANGRTIRVETDLHEVPPVSGNEPELRDLLTNLIFNAVDAMPSGGKISIRTRHHNEHLAIEVSDTGTGMTEEVRQRCMDPFFTTKDDGSTGMGLAIVYGIVQRHEGTIDIESEPGKGTNFAVLLPIQS